MELRQRTTDVGIADYLRVLYRRRIVAILTFLAVVISVAVHTFLMTPIYEAFSLVQIKEETSESLMLKELIRMNRTNPVAAEMEIIGSRTVAEAVVRELHLDVAVLDHSSGLNVQLKEVNLAADRRGKTLDVEFINDQGRFQVAYKGEKLGEGDLVSGCRVQGLQFQVEMAKPHKGAAFKFVQRPFDETVRMVQTNLGVTEIGDKTDIVKVVYRSQFPELARDIVNKTVEVYRQQNIEEKSGEASKMLGFIETQLEAISADLNLSEDDLRRYKQENKIAALSQESAALIDAQIGEERQGDAALAFELGEPDGPLLVGGEGVVFEHDLAHRRHLARNPFEFADQMLGAARAIAAAVHHLRVQAEEAIVGAAAAADQHHHRMVREAEVVRADRQEVFVDRGDPRQAIEVFDRRTRRGAINPGRRAQRQSGDGLPRLSLLDRAGQLERGFVVLAEQRAVEVGAGQRVFRQRRDVRADQKHRGRRRFALHPTREGDIGLDGRRARFDQCQPRRKRADSPHGFEQVGALRHRIEQVDFETFAIEQRRRVGQPVRVVEHVAFDHAGAALRAAETGQKRRVDQ